ncbi:serine/threonine-protein kinase [Aquibacillus rhizosphaerae]|uniref:Serine/threonine-protein kinase n=1 Tax=Aquibacillus rhizosphaerae TaxID=3051431 RepID=A0ABT7L530_9BACI|nr:serine/threonine-protein kinase [Aquibacillus sp. LR5S19]MDL4840499.1 serine/threonine-protein kinase [Aquibacillus sp. LR5S19]
MNQTSKKQGISFKSGDIINGKWHHQRYVILKQLGQGAIGSVYLCDNNGKKVALKISDKGSSVTMEVNVLKTFQKVQGNRLGPSLLDVDDWVNPNGKPYAFYVMEYLRGTELSTFIRNSGQEWLGILMLQLLDDLTSLHKEGWVFGDLKTENLIVTYPPPRLRWIDVGGTTQIGRSIKEYTEFFDRGYWNMGSRKAEPSYDLFALAMIMIQSYHPNRFERGHTPKKTLLKKLQHTSQLKLYEPCLYKALTGEYTSSEQMKQDLSKLLMKRESTRANHTKSTTRATNQTRRPNPTPTNKSKETNNHPMLESFGIIVVVFLFYLFYLLLR